VTKLVELGVLSEITGNARNRRFRYGSYIALFDESEPRFAGNHAEDNT
jgi:hypothetical protein